ncbi:MAG: FAD-dependent oxidoreductase [Verrucomicrobiota bacterium]
MKALPRRLSTGKKPGAGRPKAGRERLLVVGNGMVGSKLCERLVSEGASKQFDLSVIGEEPRPAYDRVRLSSYVGHRDGERLELLPREWYEAEGIGLITGACVSAVDTEARRVLIEGAEPRSFDRLVFATGSYPFVPPIEGVDLPGVFVYRTIEDLDRIMSFSRGRKRAVVIGGGLLGLEAAQAVQALGLEEVHVVELASFLMPQQLNEPASHILESEVIRQGIELHLEQQTEAILDAGGGALALQFGDGSLLEADLVIISAGIRPRSAMAEASGVVCGPRGGIVVDDQLETNVSGVYAVGECALHRDRIYGLVAPGYAMAEVLARRLCGDRSAVFEGATLSTRLKMLGVNVVVMGEYLQPNRSLEYEDGAHYRMLVLDSRDRLVGAMGVGKWEESGRLQEAINSRRRVRRKQQVAFIRDGDVWGDVSGDVASWPEPALVCNCMQVSKGALCSLVRDGVADVDRLARETGASTVCGSCRPLLEELAGDPVTSSSGRRMGWLLGASCAGLGLALAAVLYPGVPVADSVETWWHKVGALWRNGVFKQVSGFSLMGVSVVGLLFSLRKRFSWFSFGHFAKWRLFHAAFGVTSLVALFVHTGFHFGSNLNFWLMFVFVMLNILGAVAGIVSALENRGVTRLAVVARRSRPYVSYAHLVLFWPFPILLIFHIASVYLY